MSFLPNVVSWAKIVSPAFAVDPVFLELLVPVPRVGRGRGEANYGEVSVLFQCPPAARHTLQVIEVKEIFVVVK